MKRPVQSIFLFVILIFLLYFGYRFFQQKYFSANRGSEVQSISNPEEQTSAQAEKPKEPEKTLLIAIGDIMLGRHVGTKIRRAGDQTLPFKYTADILKSGDITFANLESPFYDQGEPITEGMIFKAEPATIEGLIFAGIDIVSLANNHFGNQGNKGVVYTFNWLKDHTISYTGAGNNISEAQKCTIVEKNSLKFCFLGYVDLTATGTPELYVADNTYPGSNPYRDNTDIESDIIQAKREADIVILSFHWGTEYQNNQNDRQIKIAHRAIDAGANLVLGHHPHVVQPYEEYKNGYIFYSLGNFVFDQMWSEETRKGEIAKINFLDKKIEKIEVVPVTIYDYNQPRPD